MTLSEKLNDVVFYMRGGHIRIWLRPQTTTEAVRRMDWSRYIGRARSGERVHVRMWLRRKEAHQSEYGSVHDPVEGRMLIRLWTKVSGKKVWFGRLRTSRRP